jgi:hypothetical protein
VLKYFETTAINNPIQINRKFNAIPRTRPLHFPPSRLPPSMCLPSSLPQPERRHYSPRRFIPALEGLPRGFRPCGHSSSKSSLSFHFTLLRSVLPRPFSFISINYSLPLLCDSEIGADPVLAHIRAIHFLLSASRVPRADQNVTITQLMAIDAAHPNAPYSHPNGSSSTLLTFYREKKGNPSKQRNNLDRSHRNSSSPDRAFMWL